MRLARPSRTDLSLLSLAIVFISLTAPLIAATDAPPLAIAFWRCLLASAVLGVWVLARRRPELLGLDRREWLLIAGAGVFLGAHFATWVPSLSFTSVASSTALVATQPVWAAVIARLRGYDVPAQSWLGIGIALVGVLFLTGVDATFDPRSLIGDGLALVGAMFAAAYVTVAERARSSVSTVTMTFGLYGWAAAFILVVTLLFGQSLVGFGATAWTLIITLTVVGQLLGHTLINRVLATTSAMFVSLAILFEMPGATVVAALALRQFPPLGVLPAALLILVGIVVVIRSSRAPEVIETAAA